MDAIFIAVTIVFFAVSIAYVRACARLSKERGER
jgi:hypothetical protein